jgi:hypothetical protein
MIDGSSSLTRNTGRCCDDQVSGEFRHPAPDIIPAEHGAVHYCSARVALPGNLHFNRCSVPPEVQPPLGISAGQQAHNIALLSVAQWRAELAAAFASREIDNTDIVAGNAMQRRAEQAAHYRIEEVPIKAVAGTHGAAPPDLPTRVMESRP